MIKRKSFIAIVSGMAIILAFIAATTVPDDSAFITHTIKKGETISLLCIEIYGYYSKELGAACLNENPSVKDINVIYVNQKLKFRKPVTEKDVTLAEADTVFQQKVDATQGVVTYVEGRAFVKKQGSNAYTKLTSNMEVYPGDVIKTEKNGRVELIINRESVVRLKENTELTIEVFRDMKKKEGTTSVNFSLGSVWSKVKQFKDKISRFELELPTAIAGVHGTVFQSTVNSDSSAEVNVYDGEVQVSGNSQEKDSKLAKPKVISKPFEVSGPRQVSVEEWVKIVRTMQSIKIDKDGKPSDPTAFQRSTNNSWEKWNEERDKRIAEMFTEN